MAFAVNSPQVREEVVLDGRGMTPARRARILARDGHKCRYPGCEETTGLEIDHTLALDLGGKDRDENLQTLCGPHHKAKTKLDMKLIAKSRRLRLKDKGEFPPPTQKISSGGFRKRWTP